MKEKRIKIICGHYGSGKSEFSINLGVHLKEQGKDISIADLDVVNPYFRSREVKEELEKKEIDIISSELKGSGGDLPSLSKGIYGAILNKGKDLIIDLGGDNVGARVLGRYRQEIIEEGYEMYLVVNANRAKSQSSEEIKSYIDAIEVACELKVTALINNTHLLKETTIDDILKGEKVAKELELEVKYTSALRKIYKDLPKDLQERFIPIDMYLRKEWMS